jgi:hypothetical protein
MLAKAFIHNMCPILLNCASFHDSNQTPNSKKTVSSVQIVVVCSLYFAQSCFLYLSCYHSTKFSMLVNECNQELWSGGESVRLTSIRYEVRSPVTANCSNPTWLGDTRKGSTG